MYARRHRAILPQGRFEVRGATLLNYICLMVADHLERNAGRAAGDGVLRPARPLALRASESAECLGEIGRWRCGRLARDRKSAFVVLEGGRIIARAIALRRENVEAPRDVGAFGSFQARLQLDRLVQ